MNMITGAAHTWHMPAISSAFHLDNQGHDLVLLTPFYRWKTKAQKGEVTCLRPAGWGLRPLPTLPTGLCLKEHSSCWEAHVPASCYSAG